MDRKRNNGLSKEKRNIIGQLYPDDSGYSGSAERAARQGNPE